MKLIADSGGTKTAWRNFSGDSYTDIYTAGMNPYYHSTSLLTSTVREELVPNIQVKEIDQIYFYGAGCSSSESCDKIEQALIANFPQANIYVSHDLLGAARALCQNHSGIIGILGTGSNSCHYDGENIVENVHSLGYILGDEGGGSHMGKLLLSDYLRNRLPESIRKGLKPFGLSKSSIEKRIYIDSNPIKFLSSFAPFILENIQDEYIKELVENNFSMFISRCLGGYAESRDYPIHFSGSIAFHFQTYLENMLKKNNLRLGSVVKDPMDGLTQYHRLH